jgi:hypothetical protein
MPSTPCAYSQVISRTFASFRVLKFTVPQLRPIFETGSIPGSSTENWLVRGCFIPDRPRAYLEKAHCGSAGLKADLAHFNYHADDGLATAIHLAVRLRRPLLLEGEAATGAALIRLTMYHNGIQVRLGRSIDAYMESVKPPLTG